MPTLNAAAIPAIRATWVNPPRDHHVRLQQVDRLREDEVAEAVRQPLVLARAERDAGPAPEIGHHAHVVLRHRLLEERDVVRLDAARELERVVAVEAAVRVDEELHAGADRFAHRPHARDVLRDHRRERARLVATLERVVADDHLEPRVALADPELCRGGELLAVEEPEAEGRIDGHAIARAAEEPPHGRAEVLAFQIPERNVDGGDGVARVPGLSAG